MARFIRAFILKPRQITFRLTPEATAFLIEKGYNPAYGARPLRRAVERFLEDPMAEEILLTGQRVIPHKAHALGFHFRFPFIAGALNDLLA